MSFKFSIEREAWENLETEHPLRRIQEIGSVIEVSAVTFPAYKATEINARSKEALENARQALESAQQQRAESLESDATELELAKAKYQFKSKI